MILVLKHDRIEGPGSLGQFLGRGGWDLCVIELGAGQRLPDTLHGVEAVICLGAQLLSKACGGTVYKAPVKEMGWSSVSLTPAGAVDPLFRSAPSPLTVFQWHGDTYSIPAGGVLLATSSRCRNQAFRMGGCAYGLQFHIEVTPDMVAAWSAAYIQAQGRDVDAAKLLFESYERRPDYDNQACGIYRNLEGIIAGIPAE